MSFDFQPENQRAVEYELPKVPLIGRGSMFFFVLFLLVIAAVLARETVVSGFKVFWGRYHARDAVASLQADQLGHAIAEIIAARQWAPDDPEVLRAIITYLKTVDGDPRELAYQIRLLGTKTALSADERITYGQALANLGQLEEARSVYAALAPAEAATPDALKLLSRINAIEGEDARADEISRRALELEKGSAKARLAIAIGNRSHSFPEFRQRSWQELWDIARSTDKASIEALSELAKDNRITEENTSQLLQLIEQHPHKTLLARLQVVDAMIRLHPQERDRLIRQEVQRFQSTGEGSLIELAAWLSGHAEHALLMQVLPRNLVADSRPLYTSLVKALVVQGRWKEIKEMLKEKRPPVSNSLASLWLADAESHLQPDLAESRRLIAFVIDNASLRVELEELELAAGLATRFTMLDLALKAQLKLATALPARRGEFLQAARENAALTKQTHVLLDISRQLVELNPSNAIMKEQHAYLRLLLGEEMETVDHDSLHHSPLLSALAAYRFGNRAAVRGLSTQLPAGKDLPAGLRAVLAGMLAAAGETGRAFQLAENVPAGLLLDEEATFLKLAR